MIVESRAAEFELEDAATELCLKLHSKAYKSFPRGFYFRLTRHVYVCMYVMYYLRPLLSILGRDTLVGVTSCATVLRMHGISFDPYTR